MPAMRWCLLWICAVLLMGAENGTLGTADKAYIEGLAAYDQALIEDALGHGELVRDHLQKARRWLDRAATTLEDLRLGKRYDEEITARLVAVKNAGKSCCGKKSLWDRYPLTDQTADKKPRHHR